MIFSTFQSVFVPDLRLGDQVDIDKTAIRNKLLGSCSRWVRRDAGIKRINLLPLLV